MLILLCCASLSAYWLGASPETFYRLYTGAAVVLFLLRWLIYQTKGCVQLPHLSLRRLYAQYWLGS